MADFEVLDANADSGSVDQAIADFAATVTSVDAVEDVTKVGRDRVLVTVQYSP